MKKVFLVLFILLGTMFLAGCQKKENDSDTDPSKTVTWMLNTFPRISSETQDAINRLLSEKGYDFKVSFVNDECWTNARYEYVEYLNDFEKNNPSDIISSYYWPVGDTSHRDFVEEHFAPLDEYLMTEAGQKLMDYFSANEWKQCSLNGKQYVVPRAMIDNGNEGIVLDGTFLSVKEEYVTFFNEFDGTYKSLKDIYHQIGDDSLCIVIDGIWEETVYGLLGYPVLYGGHLPYQTDTQTVVNRSENEVLELVKVLYQDIASGVLVNLSRTEEIPEGVFVRIHLGMEGPREGYKEYMLAPGNFEGNCKARYGISVKSKHKDLAFEALAVCMTDPDILQLLHAKTHMDRSLYENRKELVSVMPNDRLAGIELSLPDELSVQFSEYEGAFSSFADSMYLRDTSKRQEYSLNANWDADKAWEIFLSQTPYYQDVCDSINSQIDEWLKTH